MSEGEAGTGPDSEFGPELVAGDVAGAAALRKGESGAGKGERNFAGDEV